MKKIYIVYAAKVHDGTFYKWNEVMRTGELGAAERKAVELCGDGPFDTEPSNYPSHPDYLERGFFGKAGAKVWDARIEVVTEK